MQPCLITALEFSHYLPRIIPSSLGQFAKAMILFDLEQASLIILVDYWNQFAFLDLVTLMILFLKEFFSFD